MREISIVTNQLTANAAIETWFIQNVVLQELPFGLDWEIDGLKNGVVVYLELGEINTDTIDKLKSNDNKVVLCQMGDEFLTKFNRQAYESCDLVLRNYYFPEIFLDAQLRQKTLWIPNGHKSGVGPRNPATLRKANHRRFLASFLGWLDNAASFGNERALFRAAAGRSPQDLLLQPTASFAKGYNVGMYSAILEYSVFCPCPAGNSPETIRLYDALEMGCIPISLKHEFLNSEAALGNVPFPLLDSWDELPDFLGRHRATMAADPQSIVRLQDTCVGWWRVYKQAMSSRISKLLFDLRRQ